MRKRCAYMLVAVLTVGTFGVLTAGSAEASSVRERIMAKRAASGRWDCSSGTDCRLKRAGSAAAVQPAAATNRNDAIGPPTAPAPRANAATAPSGGPKRIEISIAQQQLRILEGDRVLLSTGVSTGSASYPTPTGNFSVLSKELRHWSTQYDVWMPYAMRIVGGVFIHEVAISPDGRRLGSSSIGSPASHGCIRVPVGTAARVYQMSHVGMPVSIR